MSSHATRTRGAGFLRALAGPRFVFLGICKAEITLRNDEHEHVRCALTEGHRGPHMNLHTEWTDGDTR